MKYLAVAVLFVSSLSVFAKDRKWQDAVYLGETSSQDGAVAVPIGTALIAAPIRSSRFWFRSNGLDYCLFFPSRLSGRVPNLTVNDRTKIAIEGRRVHVLDDDGKDWKLTVTMKVAPKG